MVKQEHARDAWELTGYYCTCQIYWADTLFNFHQNLNQCQWEFAVKYKQELQQSSTLWDLNCQILQIHNPHQTDDDTICDFCDGEDFKTHELFGQNALALILHCYFDEFQVTNPLGSKTKRHKLGKNIYYKVSYFNLLLSEYCAK